MNRFDELIEQALDIHPHDGPGAALLLREAAAERADATTEQLEGWLRAAEHVLLGHLDDAAGLETLLHDVEPALAGRALCAIALARGQHADLGGLDAADRVRAHYNAALALSRRRDFDGMRRLMAAAQQQVQADDAGSARAWAAVANNIAADLRFYHLRGDAPHAALMIEAARLACQAWAAAGGWLEQERADWQLAMCAAAAGEGALALQAAHSGLAACERHGADDYEFCFAQQALAQAALAAADLPLAQQARAAMVQRLAGVPEANRGYAQRCLEEIDAALQERRA